MKTKSMRHLEKHLVGVKLKKPPAPSAIQKLKIKKMEMMKSNTSIQRVQAKLKKEMCC